ncbi:MAG: tryptophanase [Calditrichaeota bacterium]|nr:tryptophanase [Calditrichota bacterium]MBT7789627.1 tryptophanase [Calditrichota bacterium]
MRAPKDIRIEPYKIKMVEAIANTDPLSQTSLTQRADTLVKSNYNLFNVPAQDVVIDLLTDSGTGAMSHDQWAALMHGDESYAQATSFQRFEKSIQEVIGDDFLIIPTHQGRAAENILFYVLNHLADESREPGTPLRRHVLINSFFDTTAANVMLHGRLTADDIQQSGINFSTITDPDARHAHEANLKMETLIGPNQLVVDQTNPDEYEHGVFGGNINLEKFEDVLKDDNLRKQVMIVMMTVTNNTGGGLPVSMANLKAVRKLIDQYAANDKPLIEGTPPLMFLLDACRFAENAYFIQQHEPGYADHSVAEIAKEMYTLVDGATMSAKKDGMVHIGGFLALKHKGLREHCWEYMVEIEGFYTYGGLAGRDLEAVAVGMKEGVDDARVKQRVEQVRQLWRWLDDAGVPVKSPCGGHGVFLKGRAFWTADGKEMIDARDLPGHTLALELFRKYGIRGCEIGTIMFGDYNPETGRPDRVAPGEDYVRLAVPRRVYTDSHLEYVAAAIIELFKNREACPWRGMRFSFRPNALPHFLSHFEPIPA